ncbi:MAG TPA: HD-GYP domain-containing protein [Quisquiliibacterium sp.]|nr:HD-GYP domain-containing protein [Quisquiliibacterium sp.]HQN13851.1 HD-GYP domain-containing protein [Quisquiliibacterium sp.]
MLKRIPVRQLRPGMHVHEFCGSWLDHPFWRARFVLSDPAEIARIVESGVQEAWIDTTKGGDVAPEDAVAATASAPQAGPASDAGDAPAPVADAPGPSASQTAPAPPRPAPPPAATAPPAPSPSPARGTPLHRETERAAKLIRHGKRMVMSLYGEARLGQAIDAVDCMPLVDEITASVNRNPGALISLARLKTHDEYTYMHSVAVCALMVAFARQIGLPPDEVRLAGLAGLMHDMGKALMPLEVLNKPGALAPAEFEIMKSHPQRGHALLRGGRDTPGMVLDVCLHHHEKVDGTGYPFGLTQDRLSVHARMGAICDVYDAVTSNRPYKGAWTPNESVRRMAQWAGHFDAQLLRAFVRTVGIYPTGSLVRLHSERLAVVLDQHAETVLTPRVRAFFSLRSNLRIAPIDIDLGARGCRDRIVSVESPGDWAFDDLDALWAPEATVHP